jgi:hypothetical protein
VRDRNIFQRNVEFLGTLQEVGSDAVADRFTLCDQFCGIELSNDGLEDFVSNGRQDSFVIILAEILHPLANTPNALDSCGDILGKS